MKDSKYLTCVHHRERKYCSMYGRTIDNNWCDKCKKYSAKMEHDMKSMDGYRYAKAQSKIRGDN